MFAPRFRLTPTNKDDLAAVCALGPALLTRVWNRMQSEAFTIRRDRVEQVIEAEAGSVGSAALSRVLFGVAGAFRRTDMSASEALDGLTQALGDHFEDDDPLLAWADCKPILLGLLETRSIKFAAKAIDISYDFERVYVAGRLLTSIRPVFDDPRVEIVGTTIVQTLRIEYISADGRQSTVSVALDIEDIKELQEECRRAIGKADSARNRIEKDCSIEAIIPGEEAK